jgi:phosphorylated CTD-interacting factor 1
LRPAGGYEAATAQLRAYERLLDVTELPAVAVYRAEQLQALGHAIERLVPVTAAKPPAHLAGDLVNKIVFREAPGFLTGVNDGGSADAAMHGADVVIPSFVCPVFLANQLQTSILPATTDERKVQGHVLKLQLRCSHASVAVAQYACEQRELWRRRLANGARLSDVHLGMSCVPDPTDSASVLIKWRREPSGDGPTHIVRLWRSHYVGLQALHRRHRAASFCCASDGASGSSGSSGSASFGASGSGGGSSVCVGAEAAQLAAGLELTHIFAMVVRYEVLAASKAAYQAALPPRLMTLLQARLGCTHECYASPLNRSPSYVSFCSAFADTDRHFGSCGSFFQWWPETGSFECNPPFDAKSIIACFDHIAEILSARSQPLSFVLTVPTIDRPTGRASHALQAMSRRGLWRASIEVAAHEHVYQMGLQHRRCGTDGQGDRRCWKPLLASTAYILQNEEGAKTWPVTEGLADEVRRAWACV